MIAVIGILALDVRKVCCRGIQPVSEKLGDENGNRRQKPSELRGLMIKHQRDNTLTR